MTNRFAWTSPNWTVNLRNEEWFQFFTEFKALVKQDIDVLYKEISE